MLKVSRFADYSVMLLTQLAAHPSSLMQTPDLALVTGLSVPTVAKTLKKLSQAGLVESRRGAKGGYALVRDAANIPVTEIIAAIDGPIALTECTVDAGSDCEIESCCSIRAKWHRVNKAVINVLNTISLADMAPENAPFIPHRPFDPVAMRPGD
ncbi:MAG: SUF system Fe-S cluster assembly regulator [Rhodospirillaceae bacterium]|nr:SUF system Fe-S cluster assembly regulator [Rhodospirillaceae bacterium]|tara:strand:- start:6463 stop:6924 length:462 start_codon:yes stop_codon:yes gene_type:complete